VHIILCAADCARVSVEFIVAQMSGRLVKLFIHKHCGAQKDESLELDLSVK